MGRPSRLDDAGIAVRLPDLPGWEIVDGKLHREFGFDDFVSAFGYNRVVIDLTTHDAGGLTQLDFELAAAATRLFG
jgi:4a-hydroxytetrahydrobiopterin dehydratase